MRDAYIFLDGAMGSEIQKRGMKITGSPVVYNFSHPEQIEQIHRNYVNVGAKVLTTNTFGNNVFYQNDQRYTIAAGVEQAVAVARKAIGEKKDIKVALDISGIGKLGPEADIPLENQLRDTFREQARAGVAAGCDLVLLETFTSLRELVLAIQTIKETVTLPIWATMCMGMDGKTFQGDTLAEMVETLMSLKVDALGINCMLAPREMRPLVEQLVTFTELPLIVQPNLGQPKKCGDTWGYPVSKKEYVEEMVHFAQLGVQVLGGCCGVGEDYLSAMIERVNKLCYYTKNKLK